MQLSENLHAFLWDSMTVNNCNTYLIDGPARILIDPGLEREFGHVTSNLDLLGLSIDDIDVVICTHAHPDHISAIKHFSRARAKFALHKAEWDFAKSMESLIKTYFKIDINAFMPDFFLKQGDLHIKGIDFEIMHTPGHSEGGICIYWPGKKALFCGDTIFQAGVGRVDLPGGNLSALMQSIEKLSQIDIEFLLPGHGPIVQGNADIKQNFMVINQFL